MKNILMVFLMSLSLIACGGGDSGSSSGPSNSDKPVTVKTEDLLAPDDFTFNPITLQKLTIDLSGSLPERTHVSVYSLFSEVGKENYIVNYDSKIIDSAMTNGQLTLEFSLAESQSEIVVEIWSYDGSQPLQKMFEINGEALVW